MNALAHTTDPVAEREAALAAESLTAAQWYGLLGITQASFSKRAKVFRQEVVDVGGGKLAMRQVYAFASLPLDWQATLEARRAQHGAESCRELLDIAATATRKWTPPRPWTEYGPQARMRATHRQAMLAVWFGALNQGATKTDANRRARAEWTRVTGRAISEKQVYRVAKQIEERGGELAPLEAYVDEKECPHLKARLSVPEEFIAAVKSKVLEPGVRLWAAAVRHFEIEWLAGRAVPGLGTAHAGEAFPYTAQQLRKFAPSKAARETAGRGKFAAKTAGLLPALPIGRRTLGLRERIVFDDKRLDIMALDDNTGNPVTLTLYLAMDESTREILGYLLREDKGVTQTDVEALTAYVMRVCGVALGQAGYFTTLKFERGTVAISKEREQLLKLLFPGLMISRTGMIGGHNAPGDFAQAASGNFFGKAVLESFMSTLDKYTAHIPGQRGNTYRNQPLMLGDLFTTGHSLAGARVRKGTMIEEAVLCAQTAQALHFRETGTIAGALTAAQATGVKAPLLYTSEVNLAVQAAVAYYNAQRGHSREGFEMLNVIKPNGGLAQVRESSSDKAARLARDLEARGRGLTRISAAHATVLLHKVKRVTVTPNGAVITIGKQRLTYWHEHSLAVSEAQHSSLGEKQYLALYNPEDPRELYLLDNAVGSVPANATEIPEGYGILFLEALPLYEVPEITDAAAMGERATRVAANHARIGFEIVRGTAPFIEAQTERRAENLRLTKDLAASLRLVTPTADPRACRELPADDASAGVSAAVAQPATRREQRVGAESALEKFQRQHGGENRKAETGDRKEAEAEPEIF
jgi:hypothetical protein